MISHNPDSNCTNARLYYYDFLSQESREGIPKGALEHIQQCRNCQSEMDSLKDLLVKVDEKLESEQSRIDSAMGTLLRLHFDHIAEPVKCDTVKPFLASLADPVLQMRIPSPITTHINKCKTCRNDLQKLLDLHLPHKYLCRLGQIFAEKPVEDEFSCSQAQADIPAVVSMAFGETNAETLKHLCTCRNCREQLYLHRESIREGLLFHGALQNGFPCDSVSAADIYNYCLPYGIDPADDEYAEFQESFISHFRKCPKCLAKMQELHRTISNIVEREESGVITIFDIDETVETKSSSESELYAGSPAGPEMAGNEDNLHIEQPKTINLSARLKEKIPALNLKPLLKVGLAAAAVIVIGLALLFNSPAAKAVSFEQIYRAIENVRNVYITTFTGKMELTQERWVSRPLNIYMTKAGEESALFDLTNKVRKVTNLKTGFDKTSNLPVEMINKIERNIAGSLGLIPFTDISKVPSNAEWKSIENDGTETAKDIEKYDLTWSDEPYSGSLIHKKWRFFVDTRTHFPKRTEFYIKQVSDNDYILRSIKIIESLSDEEIEAVIDKVSF